MEENTPNNDFEQHLLKWHKGQQRGRIAAGILVVIFGTLFLLQRLDFKIKDFWFEWPMILIAVGIVALVRHKFKKLHGYVLILIGLLFMLASWYPKDINRELILPIAVILIGISIIFKKRNHHRHRRGKFSREDWKRLHNSEICGDPSGEDYLDSVNFFGGLKKNITSQNFKGADLVTICGGTDVNLTNASFEGNVVMDITCIFAGTTISIPSDWQLTSEITTAFGGIEDKRPSEVIENANPTKKIILKGTCFFGGIEINNFMK